MAAPSVVVAAAAVVMSSFLLLFSLVSSRRRRRHRHRWRAEGTDGNKWPFFHPSIPLYSSSVSSSPTAMPFITHDAV